MSLIIGTRGSKLALWQAEHIKARLKDELGMECELKVVKTQGDKILDVPLAKIGGKGLFTKELEELLLGGEIDLAVHSLKDMPVEFPQGLGLVAIIKRSDYRDCFVSQRYANLDALPQNAKIGSTSLRRCMQLKLYRKDYDTLSLRGNVQTRLQKLQNGEFDAIVLANAAIARLELTKEITYLKPLDFMLPAMGQGALGIECALDNTALVEKLSKLTDVHTSLCCTAEREFIRVLEGGCQVPIGVYAHLQENRLSLEAIIGLPDGSESMRAHLDCTLIPSAAMDCAKNLGIELAKHFIAQGARELLAKAYEMI
ncbi:MAG: hydroxymethylbilane synthase [Helicobacter sp.]|nr:hydroxymethylbilane synthase [Helicobacter sp.]MCI7485249.1 hydroxymethylbilane synthase [Helicobacter sp.]